MFVISLKAQKGPSKEDDYGLDSNGRLIVASQVSGGHVPKLEVKRVYDRARP